MGRAVEKAASTERKVYSDEEVEEIVRMALLYNQLNIRRRTAKGFLAMLLEDEERSIEYTRDAMIHCGFDTDLTDEVIAEYQREVDEQTLLQRRVEKQKAKARDFLRTLLEDEQRTMKNARKTMRNWGYKADQIDEVMRDYRSSHPSK